MRLSLLCPTPPSRGIGGAPVVELLVILAVGVGHFPVFDRIRSNAGDHEV